MERHIEKGLGLKRHLIYIKESFVLMFKYLIEYKINIYSMFITIITWHFSQFILISIISNNFGELISWEFKDFILFIILANYLYFLVGLFSWGNVLFSILKKGDLNGLLTKPLNNKIKFYFYKLDGPSLIFILMSIIYTSVLLIIYEIKILNISLFIPIALLVTFLNVFFWLTLDTFELIKMGITNNLLFIREISDNLQLYPSGFFKFTNFKFILNLVPIYFISSLLIPIATNKIINLKLQLTYLFSILIVLFIIFFINWHYGLKKYEAFG